MYKTWECLLTTIVLSCVFLRTGNLILINFLKHVWNNPAVSPRIHWWKWRRHSEAAISKEQRRPKVQAFSRRSKPIWSISPQENKCQEILEAIVFDFSSVKHRSVGENPELMRTPDSDGTSVNYSLTHRLKRAEAYAEKLTEELCHEPCMWLGRAWHISGPSHICPPPPFDSFRSYM